jgi:tRNA uridine 5-carbamoylmethylation protein Kti12
VILPSSNAGNGIGIARKIHIRRKCKFQEALLSEFCSLDELITRFEEPIARNRWDSPLFVIQPDDQGDDVLDRLLDTFHSNKTVKPNNSTVPVS